MTQKLHDDVIHALENAKRTAGWNNRQGDAQQFILPNRYGLEPCVLIVVPARRWAYRRWDRQAVESQRRGGGA